MAADGDEKDIAARAARNQLLVIIGAVASWHKDDKRCTREVAGDANGGLPCISRDAFDNTSF
jgi:hypothetical protein